jgi:hypothetical protein
MPKFFLVFVNHASWMTSMRPFCLLTCTSCNLELQWRETNGSSCMWCLAAQCSTIIKCWIRSSDTQYYYYYYLPFFSKAWRGVSDLWNLWVRWTCYTYWLFSPSFLPILYFLSNWNFNYCEFLVGCKAWGCFVFPCLLADSISSRNVVELW